MATAMARYRRGPEAQHPRGSLRQLSKRHDDDRGPMLRYERTPTGRIAQVKETFGYLAPAYATMNQRQVAIGESTFGGRKELVSSKGSLDCDTLTRLMLERATTARQAIRIAGDLLKKHGWCDEGEALTIADPKEVWLMEIVGPGKDAVGAVWAAEQIPDDHVSVVANAADRRDRPCQAGMVPGLRERASGCPGPRLLGPAERPALPLLRGL